MSFVNNFLSNQIYLQFLKLHTAGFLIVIPHVGCPLTAFLYKVGGFFYWTNCKHCNFILSYQNLYSLLIIFLLFHESHHSLGAGYFSEIYLFFAEANANILFIW